MDASTAFDVDGSSIVLVQRFDPIFPWVQPVAYALDPSEVTIQLPWPREAPSFADVQLDAIALLRAYPAPTFFSPANLHDTWRALCIVCRNGTEDAQLLSEDKPSDFQKSPILKGAPALDAFLALFGTTLRVRLSVLQAGGLIGWHTDANVVETGRLVLHLPIFTSEYAVNRLGHVIFQMPQGRIHWADYSLPHTVYNFGEIHRVHLIIDVVTENNEQFERNFLRHLPSDAQKTLERVMRRHPDDEDDWRMHLVRSLGMVMTQGYAKVNPGSLESSELKLWRSMMG